MASLRYSVSAIVESRPLKIQVVHPALKSQVYHMKTNSQNFEKKKTYSPANVDYQLGSH